MQPDDARILDILIAADEITDYVRGRTFDEYLATSMMRAGVQWHTFVIGEAVRQLSASFKTQHSTVPWGRIVGARNILAHEYGRINHQIVWEIATVHIPALVAYLKPFTPSRVEE